MENLQLVRRNEVGGNLDGQGGQHQEERRGGEVC